jgi:Carboxypeptidase regulatory-like domain
MAIFTGLVVGASGLAADGSVIEGTVKDTTGHPMKDAVVRIEGKHFSATTKTDARGHYVANGLAAASYKVTLIVNGQTKASIVDAKTQGAKPTQLNFDLTQVKRKAHHRVWVSNTTGTLIGGTGHWIDVDENGVPVDDANSPKAGANPVDSTSGAALRAPNTIRPSSKPGG